MRGERDSRAARSGTSRAPRRARDLELEAHQLSNKKGDASILAMRAKYREIRKQVYEQATAPDPRNDQKHRNNQSLFRKKAIALCDRANLKHYKAATLEARTALWNQLWTKNRYAGIRAQLATTEIGHLTSLFNNYRWFCDRGWDIDATGYRIRAIGGIARTFLDRTGAFAGKQTIGNVPKLKTIVAVARSFARYFDEHPGAAAIEFVSREAADDDVWTIHDRLMKSGYTADLTALHFMMDVGFGVIKPDIVISRLALEWGWLHHANPFLPVDLTRSDLIGDGTYGSQYLYTKPIIYKPVINLARTIVHGVDAAELTADIGWATNNPLREFDILLVKAGQLPEKGWGIERRLYP
jgi:hypothetical protein